jgi:hypothetical protein
LLASRCGRLSGVGQPVLPNGRTDGSASAMPDSTSPSTGQATRCISPWPASRVPTSPLRTDQAVPQLVYRHRAPLPALPFANKPMAAGPPRGLVYGILFAFCGRTTSPDWRSARHWQLYGQICTYRLHVPAVLAGRQYSGPVNAECERDNPGGRRPVADPFGQVTGPLNCQILGISCEPSRLRSTGWPRKGLPFRGRMVD